MIEVRCPGVRKGNQGEPCNRLTWVISDDFGGAISFTCRRCGTAMRYPASSTSAGPRLLCGCSKWLASGSITRGFVQMVCPRDKMIVRLSASGAERSPRPVLTEIPQDVLPRSMRAIMPTTTDEVVALVMERWDLLRIDRSRRSTDLAVGIRFDVFARDDFRCVYCGRGPSQGVMLEADHVLPRSLGGADTLANLVTACWDCNRGKSAKRV